MCAFQILMPPLRDRRDDIPGLLRHVIDQRVMPSGATQRLTLDPEAEDLLANFTWPGNVRQLENVLHRAAILADGGCIRTADLPPEVSHCQPTAPPGASGNGAHDGEGSLRDRVRRFELALIRRAIDEAGGDRRVAALRLGIGLSSLYRKLEETGGEG
jgi:two-component system response regulator AtoC